MRQVRDLREEILEILKKAPSPVALLDLSKALHIKSDSEDYEYLRQILTTMSEEGLIVRHNRRRYGVRKATQNSGGEDEVGIKGVLTMQHQNGVVTTDDPDIPVVHVRRQHILTALDGDTVLVLPHAQSGDKRVRGEVIAVVERTDKPISGTIEYDGSFFYLIPDESKHYVDFLVAEKNLKGARPGDKAIAHFLRWEHATASPEVTVTEIVGRSGDASVEFAAIMREFRLPHEFPAAVEAEAAACAVPPRNVPKDRLDLRKELIITIDPDDARDFDDALSLRVLENGNVELGVHIADVTHYVKEGTALDAEAQFRGNSTYLVDGVVPMLPERLSNDLCSLVPNQNRMAYSVFMEFTSRGVRKSYRIAETMIKSKRRFTYDEVQKIITSGKGDHSELVQNLHKLSRQLFARRMANGGIDFETQEVKFILDENKMPTHAVVKSRTDATSLVEECMLAANRTVAEHLHVLKKAWKSKTLPPFSYRIHASPEPERLADAVGVIRALGYDVPSGPLKPGVINDVLRQAHGKPEHPVVNQLLLRSMAKAVYAEHNIGHYGLGFEDYAHFTSPIRRYPDLFVHRVLKEYALGRPKPARWETLLNQASVMSDHSTQTERMSVEAERASTKLAQTILAREHLGEDFVGDVTGVTNFGVFVTIRDLRIEGLLHIRDLHDDFYYFDEKRFRLVGRGNKRVFMFGTTVNVRVVRADVKKRSIDLHLQRDPQADTHGQPESKAKQDAHREASERPPGTGKKKRSGGGRKRSHGGRNDQQSGNQQSGNQRSVNQQSGNQRSGNQRSDNQQSGNQQSGNQQSGNQRSGNQRSDNQQSDNQQPGNQRSRKKQSKKK